MLVESVKSSMHVDDGTAEGSISPLMYLEIYFDRLYAFLHCMHTLLVYLDIYIDVLSV